MNNFSQIYSEGFPFIIGDLGAGLLFVSSDSSGRRRVAVVSSSRRRRVVNSVSMGEIAEPLLFEYFHAN